MGIFVALGWLFVGVLSAVVSYRAVLAVAYLAAGRRTGSPGAADSQARFAVLIPAHDEELLIADVVASIRAVEYPADRVEVIVIADNCGDGTAERARAAGAEVFERSDPDNPGKGQALDWALGRMDLTSVDAVAFFDADNLVDRGFFLAANRELARGRRCLQGYYGISNPDDSTMTRLLAVTYVMRNLLFNAGKDALGLSVVLMGTGMVIRSDVLARCGWKAMSIGEDLEQTLSLLEQDELVWFVPDALTRAQESSTLGQGYTQRQRWASGRSALSARARRAIVEGLRRRDLHRVDIGADLLMPSYAKLVNLTVVAAIIAGLLFVSSPTMLLVVGVLLGYQVAEGLVALVLMRAKPRFVASLLFAPVFLMWRAVIDLLALVGHRRDAWTRTSRTSHGEADVLPPPPAG